jgi:hypothetical protein
MSADNWGVCPQCEKNIRETRKSLYGQVTESEYLRLVDKGKMLESTLREDYEIGIDQDGEFYVSYLGHCDMCGFEFSYEYKQQLELK